MLRTVTRLVTIISNIYPRISSSSKFCSLSTHLALHTHHPLPCALVTQMCTGGTGTNDHPRYQWHQDLMVPALCRTKVYLTTQWHPKSSLGPFSMTPPAKGDRNTLIKGGLKFGESRTYPVFLIISLFTRKYYPALRSWKESLSSGHHQESLCRVENSVLAVKKTQILIFKPVLQFAGGPDN